MLKKIILISLVVLNASREVMLTFLCRLGKNDVDMQAGWFLVEVCLSLYRAVSVDEGYEGIQHF